MSAVQKKIEKIGVTRYKRHLLLCVGPKCIPEGQGKDLWSYVKKKFEEKGLTNQAGFRSKVGCLRVCSGGAIAVVYPEGTWYGNIDEKAVDRIIDEHMIAGKIVSEYRIADAEGLAVTEDQR